MSLPEIAKLPRLSAPVLHEVTVDPSRPYSPIELFPEFTTYKVCALSVAAKLHVSAKAIPQTFLEVFMIGLFLGTNAPSSCVQHV